MRKTMIPRRAHVGQIAGAGGDGRYLVDVVASAPRKNLCCAIDRRVRQPAFRACDEAPWHLRAEAAREPADHGEMSFCAVRAVSVPVRSICGILSLRSVCSIRRSGPGQLQVTVAQFAARSVITHRWQQRPCRYLTGTDELFDLEDANVLGPRLDIRDDRIAGAQIDTDEVLLHRAQAWALPRTSNSTFQRSPVPRGMASSSSVPASVTRACSFTGTISPGLRPSGGNVA